MLPPTTPHFSVSWAGTCQVLFCFGPLQSLFRPPGMHVLGALTRIQYNASSSELSLDPSLARASLIPVTLSVHPFSSHRSCHSGDLFIQVYCPSPIQTWAPRDSVCLCHSPEALDPCSSITRPCHLETQPSDPLLHSRRCHHVVLLSFFDRATLNPWGKGSLRQRLGRHLNLNFRTVPPGPQGGS